MTWRLLADFVVIVHLAFVLFALLGGLFVLRWPRMAWLHLPVVAWGAYVEFSGTLCPLTPLENWLRRQGGEPGYSTGFIEHYVVPVLYPAELSRDLQLILGGIVIAVNVFVYSVVWMRRRRSSTARGVPRPGE